MSRNLFAELRRRKCLPPLLADALKAADPAPATAVTPASP
jgi:hypothetical protein